MSGHVPDARTSRSDSTVRLTARQLLDYNAACQRSIDGVEAKLSSELGIGKSDIAFVPVIYVRQDFVGARADALTAGMVNMLVLGKSCIAPKPYGPVAGGQDLFEKHFRETLIACGLDVTFVDDWYTYHVLLGEVHCGSNTLRVSSSTKKWWEFQP